MPTKFLFVFLFLCQLLYENVTVNMCTQISLYAFRWNLKALFSIYFLDKAVLVTLNLPFILFYAALSYMTKTMALPPPILCP